MEWKLHKMANMILRGMVKSPMSPIPSVNRQVTQKTNTGRTGDQLYHVVTNQPLLSNDSSPPAQHVKFYSHWTKQALECSLPW